MVDFDLVYGELIAPAVEETTLQWRSSAARAGGETKSGIALDQMP